MEIKGKQQAEDLFESVVRLADRLPDRLVDAVLGPEQRPEASLDEADIQDSSEQQAEYNLAALGAAVRGMARLCVRAPCNY